jgi:hypothetical protein
MSDVVSDRARVPVADYLLLFVMFSMYIGGYIVLLVYSTPSSFGGVVSEAVSAVIPFVGSEEVRCWLLC